MGPGNNSAATRQFVASSVVYSANWGKLSGERATKYWTAGFALTVVLVLLYTMGPSWGIHLAAPHIDRHVWLFVPPAMVIGGIGIMAYMLWRSRQKYVITATSEGLGIDRRRADIYPFTDAQLGLWVGMGVALHLRSGRHRFVLGGRDRRLTPATPLTAAPVQLVDAWLTDAEFDELLSMSAHWNAAHGPVMGEPTRCPLFPNPEMGEQFGSFAFRRHLLLERSVSEPSLFLDIDDDGVRVIDAIDNALRGSAATSQVTATPVTYQLDTVISGDGSTHTYSATPGLVVSIPGVEPLAIGCIDSDGIGLARRFQWRGAVPVENARSTHRASGADLRTLAETFGVNSALDDTTPAP